MRPFIFSVSTFRGTIILKHITGLTLKPLSDTTWESRTSNNFQFLYNIYDLKHMTEETQLKHCKDFQINMAILLT